VRPRLAFVLLFCAACEAPTGAPPREAAAATASPRLEHAESRGAGVEASDEGTATGSETGVVPAPEAALAPFGGPVQAYPWPRVSARYVPLAERLAPPEGARRVELARGSYGAWLRYLPVRPSGAEVKAFDGRRILAGDDRRLAAVVDLDLIGADLQQCADTILRLRAEYLHASGEDDRIGFHFVSGFHARWADYRRGTRVRLVDAGRRVEPYQGAKADASRRTFERYFIDLFSYASTVSLAREAKPVTGEPAVGDFFILPGGPGHTVVIVDLARGADGSLFALLAQGFMPAQDLHVLRASPASPWYRLESGEPVDTPMWAPFPWSSLRRLP
jgi:hypothetical protein